VYYLASSSAAKGNGIAYTASADLDLDHIVDYIYAGDLKGNVWRFDVTSQDPTKWAVSASSPLFTTPAGQPITAGITVSTLKQLTTSSLGGEVIDNSKPERVIINFGTGQQIPETTTAAAQYASGQQYIFGIWDWDMNAPLTAAQPGWNAISPSQQAVGLGSPQTITLSTLEQQTITTVTPAAPAQTYRTVSENPVCWVTPEPNDTSSMCPNPGTQFGWYMQLPGTDEQVVFNPTLSPDGELVVNTYIPLQDSPLSCSSTTSGTGFTMAIQPGSGAGSTSGFFTIDTNNGSTTTANAADGVQLNGTGIPWFISSGQKGDNNSEYLITQTSSGPAPPMATNRHVVVAGKRLNWVQRR
ncbi:MAG: PilC/PilY family type IV pilus protein, partial [Steroidobacteraceae bacterium]